MVELELLAIRYTGYLWGAAEGYELACLVDAAYLLYSSHQHWKYICPRFITFDWRDELKIWLIQ